MTTKTVAAQAPAEPAKTESIAAGGPGKAAEPPADGTTKTETPAETKPAEKTAAAAAPKPAAAAAEGTEPESKDGAAPPQPKAPAKYELLVPKGAEEWLDPADIKSVEKIARDNDFTNEQAQELLEREADRMAAQSAAFRQEVEADPVYGGDNLIETQRHARMFLDTMRPAGTPDGDALRRMLNRTGYGNHKAVVSLFADVGRLMADDKPIGAKGAGAQPKRSREEVLYDKTPKSDA